MIQKEVVVRNEDEGTIGKVKMRIGASENFRLDKGSARLARSLPQGST